MKLYIASLLLACSVLSANAAKADDGMVKQDQQRVDQDKKDLKEDKTDLQKIDEKIKADKASGNTAELKKDEEARKEALRSERQERKRLKADRKERNHDEKHP